MIGTDWTLGIVGGTGMLGQAIARAVLDRHAVPPERLRLSNRSGVAKEFADIPAAQVGRINQDLADACNVILLSVPPDQAHAVSIRAEGKLVISVMAGVSLDDLRQITGAQRIIRAMSSPAARDGLAYSPWCATAETTPEDAAVCTRIFSACGLTDRVEGEAQIECFTAMTGPVPGFVAFFAEAMVAYAVSRDIPSEIADRAVRQLFLGAGTVMSASAMSPSDHVEQMIEYAGTTAAGLEEMRRSSISSEIARALDAAVARTRTIGKNV